MNSKIKEENALLGGNWINTLEKLKISLVWLSWLGIILQSKTSLVQFLVRTYAQVVGLVPGQGAFKRQPIHVSLTRFLPLLPFSKNKKIFKKILLLN